MHAVRTSDPGSVALVDAPEPVAGDGEVVVEVEAASVCSTDRKIVARGVDEPRVLGHELTGRLSDGTLVGVHPEVTCGVCPACRAGWENRCPRRDSIGIARDGGLAERVAVPLDRTVPLGELDATTGALLEPLACVVHAVEVADVPPGAKVLVVGGGAMGVLSAWVLGLEAEQVALRQRSEPRRGIARGLGIEHVLGVDDDPADALGGAPDVVFVTTPGAEPLQEALELVAWGGIVHAFAGTPGGAQVDANLVHYGHLRLVGSTGSRLADYRTARSLAAEGRVSLDRLPHRVVTLGEVPAVLEGDDDPAVLKTIVAVGTQTGANAAAHATERVGS